MFSAEKEKEFILAAQNGDNKARETLTLQFLNWLKKKAFTAGYNNTLRQDLLGQAYLGFSEAIDKWSPDMNARLTTYANFHVRNRMFEFLARENYIVSVKGIVHSKNQYNRLRKERKRLGVERIPASMIDAVSKRTKISKEQIMFHDNYRLAPATVRYADGEDTSFLDTLADNTPGVDQVYEENDHELQIKNLINKGLDSLLPREREIVMLRWISDPPLNQGEVAEKFNVTKQRISQIELKALGKLRLRLKKETQLKELLA